MTLLYRVEALNFGMWAPVKIRVLFDGQRITAEMVEWHKNMDRAIEYAKAERESEAKRYAHTPHLLSRYRVADHLGNVHWKGDGVN